jgi:hypothetical protein
VWCPGQYKGIPTSPFLQLIQKAIKKLTAFTLEINCDQTAMGLPPAKDYDDDGNIAKFV